MQEVRTPWKSNEPITMKGTLKGEKTKLNKEGERPAGLCAEWWSSPSALRIEPATEARGS